LDAGDLSRAAIAEQVASQRLWWHGSARELIEAAQRADARSEVKTAVGYYGRAVERGMAAADAAEVAPALCELAIAGYEPDRAEALCADAAAVAPHDVAGGLVLRRAELLRLVGRREDAAVLVAEVLKRWRASSVVGRAWVLRARLAADVGDQRAQRRAWAKAERAVRRAPDDAALADALATDLAARAEALTERAARVTLPSEDGAAFTVALRQRARLARDAVEAWRRVVGTRAAAWAGRAALGEADVYAALHRDMEAAVAANPALHDLPPEPHAGKPRERIPRFRDEAWRGYGAALRLERTGPRAWAAAAGLARLRPSDYPVARVPRLGLSPQGDDAALWVVNDGQARRRALEHPRDPVTQLDLAVAEARAGRRALAERAMARAWRAVEAGGAPGPGWYLSAARLWAWLGEARYAREALERAAAPPDGPAEALELLGADDLATLRYTDAETAFRSAVHAGDRSCASLLGYALARVGEAKGDPKAYPAEPFVEYLQRCPDPEPLALLWLARHRQATGDTRAATDLCRRYVATPSIEDPTDGLSSCRSVVRGAR